MAKNPNKRKCHAHAKQRGGAPCDAWAMRGRDVCYMHGGKTPRGFALPQTTHGRWAQDLPTHLAARYREALEDPDLLSLRRPIALVDALVAELLHKLDTAGVEQGQVMREIGEQIDRYRQLKEAEAKRLVSMQQTITAERANLMLGVIISILTTVLRKHLDESTARMIYADISRGLDTHLGAGITGHMSSS